MESHKIEVPNEYKCDISVVRKSLNTIINFAMDPNFFYIHILLLCIFGSHFGSADNPRKIVKSYQVICFTFQSIYLVSFILIAHSFVSSIKYILQNLHGDTFDCVSIYDQPAFDHSLLKDHKIKVFDF